MSAVLCVIGILGIGLGAAIVTNFGRVLSPRD